MLESTYRKEPILCMLLFAIMIFEVPYMNVYLMASLFMLIVYVANNGFNFIVNLPMVLLLAFGISYFAIDSYLAQSTTFKIWYVISMVSTYMCGNYVSFREYSKEERSQKVVNLIKLIAVTYIAFVGITMIYSIISGQMLISRNPLNIWTGTLRAATHFGTMLVIPAAYGIWLAFMGKTGNQKAIGILILLFAVVVSLMTASRTILYLIPIGIVIIYIWGARKEGLHGKYVNWLLVIIFLVIIGSLGITYNLFGLRTLFLKTALGTRYLEGYVPTFSDDGRVANITYFFTHFKECMWGGAYARTHSGNLHNVYLNVIDLSGMFPFILLVIFTILVIRDLRKVRKSSLLDGRVQILLELVFIMIFIQMMFEPVMESVPVMLWCTLFLCGVIRNLRTYTGG